MTTLRYAIWCAVSTKAQADRTKKVSLEQQEIDCRLAASAKGWEETAGPYIIRGESRTRWINLRDAESEIPELREMLDDAKQGRYDVLVMYDMDRLRDLLDPVSRSLADYGVQIYDLDLRIEPQPPGEFDPYSDIGEMTKAFGQMKSRAGTNALRRHYRDKMPMRITKKGLHAGLGRPPYGYRKPPGRELDKDAILVPVPSEVKVIVQIKDWFLSGWSLTKIEDELNRLAIPSPRGKKWWFTQVRYILKNPFYAGQVSFGVTRYRRDRRDGSTHRTKGKPVTAQGKHSPLWDEQTHRRIMDAMNNRGHAFGGIRTRALSRLLACGDCGAIMWAQTAKHRRHYWRCSSKQKGHVYIADDDAMNVVIDEIVNIVRHIDNLQLPAPEDKRPHIQAEITDLEARRRRWMDLYEAETLSGPELSERIAAIDARLDDARSRLADIEKGISSQAAVMDVATELAKAIDDLPNYLHNGPPDEVNADLREMFERIIVTHDRAVTLVWRS